jgi:hypothetical protein
MRRALGIYGSYIAADTRKPLFEKTDFNGRKKKCSIFVFNFKDQLYEGATHLVRFDVAVSKIYRLSSRQSLPC